MQTMRRRVLEALCATGAAGLLAHPAAAAPWSYGEFPDIERPPPARPLAVPDTEDGTPGAVTGARDRFDHLTAPVTLNGSGPYAFIVDTGASISCVSQSLATT